MRNFYFLEDFDINCGEFAVFLEVPVDFGGGLLGLLWLERLSKLE